MFSRLEEKEEVPYSSLTVGDEPEIVEESRAIVFNNKSVAKVQQEKLERLKENLNETLVSSFAGKRMLTLVVAAFALGILGLESYYLLGNPEDIFKHPEMDAAESICPDFDFSLHCNDGLFFKEILETCTEVLIDQWCSEKKYLEKARKACLIGVGITDAIIWLLFLTSLLYKRCCLPPIYKPPHQQISPEEAARSATIIEETKIEVNVDLNVKETLVNQTVKAIDLVDKQAKKLKKEFIAASKTGLKFFEVVDECNIKTFHTKPISQIVCEYLDCPEVALEYKPESSSIPKLQ
jgi:hypothetical protein